VLKAWVLALCRGGDGNPPISVLPTAPRIGVGIHLDWHHDHVFMTFAATNQADRHEKGNDQSSYPAQREGGHGNSSIKGV
jgi:hypothetical protein